jgi:hypothetical protein
LPPYLPVVATNRSSNIRIDNIKVPSFEQVFGSETTYPPNVATGPAYIDLGATVEGGNPVWKELASHISIGQLVVVGPLTATNSAFAVTGLVTTADGSDLTLTVSSGTVKNRTTGATIVSIGGTTTLSAASGSHPRIDLISVNDTTGAITHVTGTAAVSPVAPAAASGTTGIATVAVATSATSVSQANVTDVAPR